MAATGITSTNAILKCPDNPSGAATSAYFRYGLTTNYGSYSATNLLAATNITLSITNLISNLTPATSYHFQVVATNKQHTNVGIELTFPTPALPAVTTLAATGITDTYSLSLHDALPIWAATSAYFRYGLTTNYGSYSATNLLAATNITLSVTNLISNLTPATSYHFQLVASNRDRKNVG